MLNKKLHLINNELKNALKDTHVILRVSLFGVDSIEEVRDEVKKCWLYEFIASKEKISWDAEKMKKVGGTILDDPVVAFDSFTFFLIDIFVLKFTHDIAILGLRRWRICPAFVQYLI